MPFAVTYMSEQSLGLEGRSHRVGSGDLHSVPSLLQTTLPVAAIQGAEHPLASLRHLRAI